MTGVAQMSATCLGAQLIVNELSEVDSLTGRIPFFTMQVALLSGLDADGQKKLNSTKDSDHHLNKLLRVLTVRTDSGRERSGIALVGGPHDPKADGSATQRYSPFRAAVTAVQNPLLPKGASGTTVPHALSAASS